MTSLVVAKCVGGEILGYHAAEVHQFVGGFSHARVVVWAQSISHHLALFDAKEPLYQSLGWVGRAQPYNSDLISRP